MAVAKLPLASSLRLVVQVGVDNDGNPTLANRNFNRLKPNAQDEDALEVGSTLADLQLYPLSAVQRNDQSELQETGV